MSEKRFTLDDESRIWDNGMPMTALDIVFMLNEQQATIDKLDQENADLLGARIKAQEEWEKCTDKLKAKILEQQATIRRLQDLCGKSDGENAKLRIENKMLEKEIKLLKPTNIEQYEQIQKLQEENEQLRKELKRCKDWINSDKNDYELTLAFIKNKGYSLKDVLEYEKELLE